jgi:hypothetical protein
MFAREGRIVILNLFQNLTVLKMEILIFILIPAAKVITVLVSVVITVVVNREVICYIIIILSWSNCKCRFKGCRN